MIFSSMLLFFLGLICTKRVLFCNVWAIFSQTLSMFLPNMKIFAVDIKGFIRVLLHIACLWIKFHGKFNENLLQVIFELMYGLSLGSFWIACALISYIITLRKKIQKQSFKMFGKCVAFSYWVICVWKSLKEPLSKLKWSKFVDFRHLG